MVYIYFCNVLIIMKTIRLNPGWGLGQTFLYVIFLAIPCWFYVDFCPYDSVEYPYFTI